MSSADFTFITLRNINAYRPTGEFVPQNYVLNMSTNGSAVWSNNLALNTIVGSTIVGSTIVGSTIVTNGVINTGISAASTVIGNNVVALSSIVVAPTFFSTVTDYSFIGEAAVSSILIGIGDNVWKIPVQFVSSSG